MITARVSSSKGEIIYRAEIRQDFIGYYWFVTYTDYSLSAPDTDVALDELNIHGGQLVTIEHLKQLKQTDEVKVLAMQLLLAGKG